MKDGSLQKLKDRLYGKNSSFLSREKRSKIHGETFNQPSSEWNNPLEPNELPKFSFPMKKFFLIIFILVAILIAGFFLWSRGTNIISSSNIDLTVNSFERVQGGETVSADIMIENKNNSALEMADLIIEFPDGSFSDTGEKLKRERYSLGRIDSGGLVKKSINIILFGEENENKTLKINFEYRFENSNAIFAKEAEHTIMVTKPAVGVSLSMPKEVNSRQETKIDIDVVSNSQAIVKNLVLKIEYPSGFEFLRSEQGPSEDDNIWRIGDLEVSGQRKISLFGIFEGQDLEEKSFRAQVGTINDENIFVSYGSKSETITIKKPYLDLALFINGKDPNGNTIFSGDSLRGEIVWKNNLPSEVRNATVELTIKGKAWNEKTVSISDGFFRTFDKVIVWNPSSMSELKLLEPGDIGKGKFSFKIFEPMPISNINDKNFTITIDAKIVGKTASGQFGDTEIKSEISNEIKISSLLQLANRILHYSGPIINSGPMPPTVGKETTYTIIWSLGNTSNDFSGVKVSAALPSYVRWVNKFSPTDEKISFDATTGEVTWSIDSIKAGTGILSPAKEVAFQISFMPSLSQVGISPDLLTNIKFEGRDSFTGNKIEDTKQNLTIYLSNDPQFNYQEGKVVEK